MADQKNRKIGRRIVGAMMMQFLAACRACIAHFQKLREQSSTAAGWAFPSSAAPQRAPHWACLHGVSHMRGQSRRRSRCCLRQSRTPISSCCAYPPASVRPFCRGRVRSPARLGPHGPPVLCPAPVTCAGPCSGVQNARPLRRALPRRAEPPRYRQAETSRRFAGRREHAPPWRECNDLCRSSRWE